jgi:hypothetical protein
MIMQNIKTFKVFSTIFENWTIDNKFIRDTRLLVNDYYEVHRMMCDGFL